jgi:hypothetical protein
VKQKLIYVDIDVDKSLCHFFRFIFISVLIESQQKAHSTMDERNILIGSKESHNDFHEDRRRKRHIFVLAIFFMLVLFSYFLILVCAKKFKPKLEL